MSRIAQTTDLARVAVSRGWQASPAATGPAVPGTESTDAPPLPIFDKLDGWATFFTGPAGIASAILLVSLFCLVAWFWGMYSPRPGFAGKGEIFREMSARQARKMIAQTRPSLVGREKKAPITSYAVPLGRLRSGGFPTGIWGTPEQNYLILAPSRQGKSIILNSMIYRWAGAVVHTSSKVKDHLVTRGLRELLGPVWVWDPLGLSGEKALNTFRWDPIRGCEDRSVAIQRAAYLLYGSRSNPGASVEEFFKSTAGEVLARFLNAAALGNKTMLDVYAWSQDRSDFSAITILMNSGADPGWISTLKSRQEVVQGTGDGIFTTLSNALAWMANPKVAATVLPGPGEHFDAEAFLTNQGTLYMIGSKEPGSVIAPLYVMFADYLRRVAIELGNKTDNGRMDPPCLWALDEVANIIPLPVDQWMTDSGGRGLTLVLVIQSRSQLYDVWGEGRGRVVWDDANVRIYLRGIGDRNVREDISAMCGTYERTRKDRDPEDRPVMPQGKIFKLGRRQSLVIFAGCSPVLTHVRPLWKRRDVKRLTNKPKLPGQRPATRSRVSLRKGRR
ncbi:type IV secretory system conjugative DNA transfer family protein [Streptomyces beijiangensis]|uniref:type IV secretory system conjugative DNA transfer family protein n=1 Tax=Streptomyces beijiangensis TaxID=163361 RepID=UPI0031DF4B1A